MRPDAGAEYATAFQAAKSKCQCCHRGGNANARVGRHPSTAWGWLCDRQQQSLHFTTKDAKPQSAKTGSSGGSARARGRLTLVRPAQRQNPASLCLRRESSIQHAVAQGGRGGMGRANASSCAGGLRSCGYSGASAGIGKGSDRRCHSSFPRRPGRLINPVGRFLNADKRSRALIFTEILLQIA